MEEKNQDAAALINSYEHMLDIWKEHHENYFKRGNLFLAVIQAGLFISIISLFSSETYSILILKNSGTINSLGLFLPVVIVVITIIGMISSFVWRILNRKQTQYFEFCRMYIRNIEVKLGELGVPLQYFSCESHFLGYKNDSPKIVTSLKKRYESYGNYKGQPYIEFNWTKERFPFAEYDNNNTKNKSIYRIGKVKGGMISNEAYIPILFLVGWFFLFLGQIYCLYKVIS